MFRKVQVKILPIWKKYGNFTSMYLNILLITSSKKNVSYFYNKTMHTYTTWVWTETRKRLHVRKKLHSVNTTHIPKMISVTNDDCYCD